MEERASDVPARAHLARERNAEAEEEGDGDAASGEGGSKRKKLRAQRFPSSRGQHAPVQTMPLLQNMLFVS